MREENLTMTQTQIDDQVARRTGEPIVLIRQHGFSVLTRRLDDLEPEDVRLVLDCPFCRRPVPYPGVADGGCAAMAECDRCDVYFDFDLDEVYTAPAARL
jgi:hypothetical protein